MNVMNRFKFQLNSGNRPIQPKSKRQELPMLTILDNCNQIMREDRLWLRSQIKANNNQIISIFKAMKKPINMQHLQIKLRKYVNNYKSKQKLQQLLKFREERQQISGKNCYGNHTAFLCSKQNNAAKYFQQRENSGNKIIEKVRNNSNKSNSWTKTMRTPLNKISYSDVLGSTYGTKDNKFLYNYGTIEEQTQRDSENATMRRQQDNIYNHLSIKNSSKFLTGVNNASRTGHSIKKNEKGNIQIAQGKTSDSEEDWSPRREYQCKEIQPLCDNSNHRFSRPRSSIVDTHQHAPMKFPKQNNIQWPNPDTKCQGGQSFAQDHFHSGEKFIAKKSSACQTNAKDKMNLQGQKLNQKSQSVDQEGLFTPIELLNQCRKFIKYKETASKHEHSQPYVFSEQQNQSEVRNHFQSCEASGQAQKGFLLDFKEVEDFSPVKVGFEESKPQSSQKNEAKQPCDSAQFAESFPQTNFMCQTYCSLEFCQKLLEHVEFKPIARIEEIIEAANSIDANGWVKKVLKKFKSHEILMSEIFTALSEELNGGKLELETTESASFIYALLDIDKKGYVESRDVNLFLQHLLAAEVGNYNEIQSRMIKLFQVADSKQEGSFNFWQLFAIKHTPIFKSVYQLLAEFQFTIETEV